MLTKALRVDQTGSAREYSSLLAYLTATFPDIWRSESTKKKPVISYLSEYLKRGSQGGPSQVWDDIGDIFKHLPKDIMPTNLQQSLDLLEAMHEGVLRKEEPRTHLPVAWANYFHVAQQLASLMVSEEDQCNLLKKAVFPIFEQHIKSTSNSQWSIGPNGTRTCATAFNGISKHNADIIREALEAEWWRLAQSIFDDMKTSLPEQSKEYHTSQMSVAGEGDRFATLNAEILRRSPELSFATSLLRKTSIFMTRNALEVLRLRNGKPYGAALILESLLRCTPTLILEDDEALQIISDFMIEELHSMAMSPSLRYLLSCLSLFRGNDSVDAISDRGYGQRTLVFYRALDATTKAILVESDLERKIQAVYTLLSSVNVSSQGNEKSDADTELEEFILRYFKRAMQGYTSNWQLINEALRHEGKSTSNHLMYRLLNSYRPCALCRYSGTLIDGNDKWLIHRAKGSYRITRP